MIFDIDTLPPDKGFRRYRQCPTREVFVYDGPSVKLQFVGQVSALDPLKGLLKKSLKNPQNFQKSIIE